MFKKTILKLIIIGLLGSTTALEAQTDEDIRKVGTIFDNVLTQGQCYHWLHYLCKKVGNRIAGSPAGAAAGSRRGSPQERTSVVVRRAQTRSPASTPSANRAPASSVDRVRPTARQAFAIAARRSSSASRSSTPCA